MLKNLLSLSTYSATLECFDCGHTMSMVMSSMSRFYLMTIQEKVLADTWQ